MRAQNVGNAIIITKHALGSVRIDPLMAAFDAIALMSTNAYWLCVAGTQAIAI